MSAPPNIMDQFLSTNTPPSTMQPPGQAQQNDISRLSGEIQTLDQKQADVSAQEASSTQQTLSQINQLQPPQQDHKILDTMPWLVGLVAIGGKLTGLHAKTMLGATNGMVKGLLTGQMDAFQRSQQQYEQSRQKLLDTWKLQMEYYNTLYKSYGDQANAKEQAIKVSRELANDQWTHSYKEQLSQQKESMDEFKSFYMTQQLMQKMEEFDHKKSIDGIRTQIEQMNANTRQQDVAGKNQARQAQIEKFVKTSSGPDATKKIDGMITDLGKQMASLKKKYSDIETMTPEDRQQYDQIYEQMGEMEVARKKLTPLPVSDPKELEGLDDGQHYITPDGKERVKGGGSGGPGQQPGSTPQGNPGGGGGGVQPNAAGGSALQKGSDLSQSFPNPLGGGGG